MSLLVFALDTTREYGARVAAHLGLPLGEHEEREFEDGEHKARPLVDVRRREVFVIHSLHGGSGRSPSDKLCRLLFFIGALKDAGAERVTAVAPYLCYARKDRRTQSCDPITTRYVAQLFEASGADAVITCDVHNLAAFENAFRCPTTNLEAIPLFVAHFAPLLRGEKIAVVSPDTGGIKRAERFRLALAEALQEEPSAGFVDKRRSGGIVSGELLVAGDVRDRAVILFDDLISTGTTLRRAAQSCRTAGAAKVFAAATHGLFVEQAAAVLADPVFQEVAVTDTVQSNAAQAGTLPPNVVTLDSAKLVAEAIAAAYAGRQASE
ncbi:MAG TPA: ribose-phosphate diphosphokinase [Candidatus Competibacteraceae bacterium]|nr:ribose-phosphate diphosphokinase [Candidatus Competibacteraceae bacterium]